MFMDDIDKTMAPHREHISSGADEVTMPGKRDRKPDGRFAVGDLIMNRYKVLAELGQGGMGVVYKCFDETAGIEIALKALPPELSHDQWEMEDVKENFQIVHKLHNPNIAAYNNLEKDNSNGNYYLIMEYAAGLDLRQWIRRNRVDGQISLEKVLPIIQQIGDALDYAHSQKVIHRDIKPGNIIISQNDEIKVLDFGLAAQIHSSLSRVSVAFQGTGGTGPYMAPEQWRGKGQNAASDQYALAVLTYEMLAGSLPFENADSSVLREIVLNEQPEKIPGVPVTVNQAIFKAMSKTPASRFACCKDFFKALKNDGHSVMEASRTPPECSKQAPVKTVEKCRKQQEKSEKTVELFAVSSTIRKYSFIIYSLIIGVFLVIAMHVFIEKVIFAGEKLITDEQHNAEEKHIVEYNFNNDYTEIKGISEKFRQKCTQLVIPQGVKRIGVEAFKDCRNLTSVSIPASVKTIGEYAFCDCKNLTSVSIPDSVETIGESAFSGCSSLTSVSIPGSVETIGESAFASVRKVNVAAENANFYTDFAGALIDSKKRTLLYFSPTFKGGYTVPGSVKTIGALAFYGCSNLTNVSIPDGIETIGWSAFCHCSNLKSISIPTSVKTIDGNAFSDCENLTSVSIANGVETIGSWAFRDCKNLTRVSIANGVETIGYSAFSGCKNLTSVSIPDSVEMIARDAFSGCKNLTSVDIPKNCQVADGAFDSTTVVKRY